MLTNGQKIGYILAAVLYISAGALHFLRTDIYLKIMPPYIPRHLAMVYLSGVCEIVGGIGLLLPPTRRPAAWALTALLIAVFPANLYMATDLTYIPAIIRWGRLPIQLLLIWWVLWCTKAGASV